MDAYRKNIAEGTFERKFYESLGFPPISHGDDTSLVIRITLGDMELLDAFYISLPTKAASCSIEDAIRGHVLCDDETNRLAVKQKLARDPNPDLLDIYDSLLWLYEQAGTGDFTIKYHINNGASVVRSTELVSSHQQVRVTDDGHSYNLLDLVLEVHDNVDPFSHMTDEYKENLFWDFRGLFILYLMDKFDYEPESQTDQLSAILDHLASEAATLVQEVNGEGVGLNLTQRVLQNLLRERVPIRDLTMILEVIVNRAHEVRDPDVLTEYVRQVLGRSICNRYREEDGVLYTTTLGPVVEQHLADAIQPTDRGLMVHLNPDLGQRLLERLAAGMEKMAQDGHQPVLICSSRVRLRSEEHTSELQSHSFISYAVFCLKKKTHTSLHL